MRVIDLTHTICEDMPVYPGTEKPKLLPANSYEKDGFKETRISMFSHTGTHVDPPAHLYGDGKTLDSFPAEQFVGKALVIDVRSVKTGEEITMEHIKRYGDKAKEADFLLFCLGWDALWGTDEYFGDYPVINEEALDFIIQNGYKGIGFDVIGLDPIRDENLTRHKKLFERCDMINIENLKNLHLVGDELFLFCALPIKVKDSDGAPIRAVAILG
ncbi:MAG: cyclase family protein [Clostridia bacterium]|nr:cyclase family protein [Clostridia bacterium]MBQ4157888.1 cyclase family protein [Clostridia bacterium]